MNEIVRKHTHSTVKTLDRRGPGEAYHEYRVKNFHPDNPERSYNTFVTFQNGPMEEAGVNGLHNEDLLYIVKHRLQCFEQGPFACTQNAAALTQIKSAILYLEDRTKGRRERGVEGKLVL